MADLDMLQDGLLLLSAFGVGVAGTLAFLLYRRTKRANRAQTSVYPFHNTSEMSILFQTMRGLVREQKTLAKDFNRSLDAKLELVREAVRQVIAGHEQLVRMQKAFKAQLREATGIPQDAGQDDDQQPLFQAIAIPEEPDPIQSWQPQPDQEADEEDSEAEPPEAEPESDPAVEREAMGALLNMGEPPEDTGAPPVPTNGTAALRSRVYKYHDAGMSVPAIARELGLGKGEILLMLSLREG